jgi:cell division protein FtsZ
MKDAGAALMGIGAARGENRALAAAEMAVRSPLLEAGIDGARGILMSIAGGSDLGLFEINDAARLVAEAGHPDATIIFGAVIDDSLGDEVRVTVIAAGFENGLPAARPVKRPEPTAITPSSVAPALEEPAAGAPEFESAANIQDDTGEISLPMAVGETSSLKPRVVFDATDGLDDDLDVPDFLK